MMLLIFCLFCAVLVLIGVIGYYAYLLNNARLPPVTMIDCYYKIEQWAGVRDKRWVHCLYKGKHSRFNSYRDAQIILFNDPEYKNDEDYRIVRVTEEIVHADSPIVTHEEHYYDYESGITGR